MSKRGLDCFVDKEGTIYCIFYGLLSFSVCICMVRGKSQRRLEFWGGQYFFSRSNWLEKKVFLQ